MSVIIRLQGLPWSASAMDIRQFFKGLNIPPGGVHIIGGEKGDAFIAFVSDEDARKAMMLNNGYIDTNAVQLYLSSKTEMQNVIGEARNQSVQPPAEQQPPSQPQNTPSQPYATNEYSRHDQQGYPTQERSGEFNREYSRPPEEYGKPPTQQVNITPSQENDRQQLTQAPGYPETGQQQQMPLHNQSPFQRDDMPKAGYWPLDDRRNPPREPVNPSHNGDFDRYSSHSQESQSSFMTDRIRPRDTYDRPPLQRDGPFDTYPPPENIQPDRPPRERYPERLPPDSRHPREIYPDNFPPTSSDPRHQNNSSQLWDPQRNLHQPPVDPQLKGAWESGPPSGQRPNERPPWDAVASRPGGPPADQGRYVPPRHIPPGGHEDKSYDGRPPAAESRSGFDEQERYPPPHGNLPYTDRNRPYDQFDTRSTSLPRNGPPPRPGQGPPPDWNPRPSGLLATPSESMKMPDENLGVDKRYPGADMDNRIQAHDPYQPAPNLNRPPMQDLRAPPHHERDTKETASQFEPHDRPSQDQYDRNPNRGQYGQPGVPDEQLSKRSGLDQLERPPPELYERQTQHDLPNRRDPFDRPPPQHYERQPTQDQFERPPLHDQYDRPPPHVYERPPSKDRIDRDLHEFPERPSNLEDRVPFFGERPLPQGRPYERPPFSRPQPGGFPPGRPPISYGDRTREQHDNRGGRPPFPPSEGLTSEAPMDLEKDHYFLPRSMHGPPMRPQGPHGFDHRFPSRPPLARPPLDGRHPPPGQHGFQRPSHREDNQSSSGATPRMNSPFHSSGPTATVPQPLLPGLVGDPDMRNRLQKEEIKTEDASKTKKPLELEKKDDRAPTTRIDKPVDIDSRSQKSNEKDIKQDVDSRRGREDDSKSRDDDRRDRDSRERRRDSDRFSRDDRSRSDLDRRRSDYDRRDDRRDRDYNRSRDYDSRSRDYERSRDYDRLRDYDRSRNDRDRDRDRYRDDRDSRRSPRDSRDRERKDEFGRDKRPDERDSRRDSDSKSSKSPAKTSSTTSTAKSASHQSIPISSQAVTTSVKTLAVTTSTKSNWKPVTNLASSAPPSTTSSSATSSSSQERPIRTPLETSRAQNNVQGPNTYVSTQQMNVSAGPTSVQPRPLMATSITNVRPPPSGGMDLLKQPGILGAAPPGMSPLQVQGMNMQNSPIPRRAANDWEPRTKIPLIETPPLAGPNPTLSPAGKIDAADPKGLKRQYRQSTPSLCIIVKNLVPNSGYRDVRKFFQGCEIPWDGLKMINDNEGRRAGIAYVNFCSSQAYFDSLERDGRKMNDNVVEVKPCSQEEYDKAIDSFVPKKDDAKKPRLEGQTNTKVSPPKPTPKDNIVQVKGWANSVTMDELKKFFKDYKISEDGNAMYLEHDQQKRPTGMAMIKFDSVTDYNRALAMDMKQLAGKTVHIKPASQQELTNLIQEQSKFGTVGDKNGTSGGGDAPKCDYTCVHLRGLPPYTTVQDLQYTFFSGLEFGNRGMHLVLDSNGKSLGEAFAEFSSESVCARALQKDGEVFMGKAIGVKPILKNEMVDMLRMIKQPSGRLNSGPQFGRRSTFYVKTDNWPFTISIREVLSFFQGFNPIQETVRVQIGNDMQGSAAMVGFRSQEDADRAVSTLNNQFYRQRPIRMEPALM